MNDDFWEAERVWRRTFIRTLFPVFTGDPGCVAGMGARGSRAIRLIPVPHISVPLISALLCFLHWYLLRPAAWTPPRNPSSQPIHGAGSGLAPGLGFSGTARDGWRRLNSTKFLKGPTAKVPSEKIIWSFAVVIIISFNIISLDLKMSLWLLRIFRDTAALNPFSSSHQRKGQTLRARNSLGPIKVYRMSSFPASAWLDFSN